MLKSRQAEFFANEALGTCSRYSSGTVNSRKSITLRGPRDSGSRVRSRDTLVSGCVDDQVDGAVVVVVGSSRSRVFNDWYRLSDALYSIVQCASSTGSKAKLDNRE